MILIGFIVICMVLSYMHVGNHEVGDTKDVDGVMYEYKAFVCSDEHGLYDVEEYRWIKVANNP